MPKILLTVTKDMLNHIESFRLHKAVKTTSEAFRQLILDGFKFNGNPLNEDAFLSRGYKSHKASQTLAALEQSTYDDDDE